MNKMSYKNYIAHIDYDDESGAFHGHTMNTNNIIRFYGYSVDELKNNFEQAIDAYLETCKMKNISPAKPFSGQIRLRLDPDLHANIYQAASMQNMSINAFLAQAAEEKTSSLIDK